MALASRSFYSNDSDERKIYQYERSPFTSVPLSAMTYKPTHRIASLSKPKIKKDTTVREGNFGEFHLMRNRLLLFKDSHAMLVIQSILV